MAAFASKTTLVAPNQLSMIHSNILSKPKILKSALKKTHTVSSSTSSPSEDSKEVGFSNECMDGNVTWTVLPIDKEIPFTTSSLWESKTMTIVSSSKLDTALNQKAMLRFSLSMSVNCIHKSFDLEWIGWDTSMTWHDSDGELDQRKIIIQADPIWSPSSTSFCMTAPFKIEFQASHCHYHPVHGWSLAGKPSLESFRFLRECDDFIQGICTLNLSLVLIDT
ncbi:MAG: hypothetical protein Sylvanvirus1_6 [Sylvanvirus sp.]|uniref:Uncharacterized protein n=1 Tax=Sylvanvirus sp. TaxID=2487774 RepID=A0A3G5AGZ8_9VIRU|nr:MAG: hypothetical protein Sylvanvirus1_6 [Sylvanvirus sp.]